MNFLSANLIRILSLLALGFLAGVNISFATVCFSYDYSQSNGNGQNDNWLISRGVCACANTIFIIIAGLSELGIFSSLFRRYIPLLSTPTKQRKQNVAVTTTFSILSCLFGSNNKNKNKSTLPRFAGDKSYNNNENCKSDSNSEKTIINYNEDDEYDNKSDYSTNGKNVKQHKENLKSYLSRNKPDVNPRLFGIALVHIYFGLLACGQVDVAYKSVMGESVKNVSAVGLHISLIIAGFFSIGVGILEFFVSLFFSQIRQKRALWLTKQPRQDPVGISNKHPYPMV